MSDKKFNIWHRLCAVFTLLVSAVTYLLTHRRLHLLLHGRAHRLVLGLPRVYNHSL